MPTRIPLIVDTDLGLGTPNAEIDDGAALMLVANSPEIELKAITTVHGNVPAETATVNVMRLMEFLGQSRISIGQGATKPLVADTDWDKFLDDWQGQYGPTEPIGRPLPEVDAADLIIELVQEYPGEIVILALGPLTNLALALEKSPAIAHQVKMVYAMGGSLKESDQAEFNIRCDPEAAQAVFQAGWAIKIHGLEITRQALFTPQDFSSLNNLDPAQALLRTQAEDWIRIVESQGWETGGCSLHDAVAAAAVIKPDLFEYTATQLSVVTQFGARRGITLNLSKGNEASLVAAKFNARACHSFILDRIRS